MKMILHILLKDLRRQWREIGLFLLVCVEWAWQRTHPMSWIWMHQKDMIPFLFFGLWLFIVIRAVHGECLVGDREFWATRPYRWWQLLTAKILLLVLALNLPLLAAQVYLLADAKLALSWATVFGLVFLQVEFFAVATFLTFAIAAVTQTVVQWILTVTGGILFGMILSWLPWGKLPATLSGDEDVASSIGSIVVLGALTFLVVWQYARRGVWPARAALAVAILSVPAMIVLASAPLVRSMAYPSSGGPGIQISIRPGSDGTRAYTRRTSASIYGDPTIQIPVIAVPSDPNTVMNVDGIRVMLRGDNGWHWESGWMNKSFWLGAGSGVSTVEFSSPNQVADQIQKMHAAATLELAYTTYRLTREDIVDTSPEQFSLGGAATCRWFDGRNMDLFIEGFNCSAPLRLPGILVVRVSSRGSRCNATGKGAVPPDRFAVSAEFNSNDFPVEFDMDPVRHPQLDFGTWSPPVKDEDGSDARASVCRGTPITVQTGNREGRMRSTFVLGALGSERRVPESKQEIIDQDSE